MIFHHDRWNKNDSFDSTTKDSDLSSKDKRLLEEMEKDAHGSLPNATLHYALFYNTTETN